MKKDTENPNRIDQGKKSLSEMLERLHPFLPKCDLSIPKPADEWRLSDKADQSKVEKPELTCACPF